MRRKFNTAGPCRPDYNYMLPALARLPQVKQLIDDQQYFVLHAPRQTGKTTALMTLAQELTASGEYTAVLVSLEGGSIYNDDVQSAEEAILGNWRRAVRARLPTELQPPAWPEAQPGSRIGAVLQAWTQSSSRPLVVFLDEIDALQDKALIAVLRQLRDGYADRPAFFPWSLALIGMRDVRDYKVAAGGSERLRSSSPFNIKTESLTLRNFTHEEVATLYGQHTAATGQTFTEEAVARAFELTQGQPWLVNALARQVVEVLVPDVAETITRSHVDTAKEILIQRQDTHLDSLAERLREPRVRRIIEPMLVGSFLGDVAQDDIQFVLDLGLCRRDRSGGLLIANPIYQEVIPRVLADNAQLSLTSLSPTWLTPDGTLDMDRLLDAFVRFWRQHGEVLQQSVPYAESAPHLVLMAFLHRVVNAGGTIEREYAIGSGRMDICVRYGKMVLGIEVKTWRESDHKSDPQDEGLQQLDRYLSGLGLETGWLVIFDQRSDLPPIAERTTVVEATTPAGRQVAVIRG